MINPLDTLTRCILLAWCICFSACGKYGSLFPENIENSHPSSIPWNAEAEPEPIRGGNVDVENEAIWLVSIQRMVKGEWKHACGGSLISERDIITAAHCFVRLACNTKLGKIPNTLRDLKREKYRIVIGLKDLTLKDFVPGRGIEKKIKRVFIPRDYDEKGIFSINDIAVIRLQKPLNDEDRKINSKNKFGYIPLFRPNGICENNCTGRKAFGAGFGVINIKENGVYEMDGLRKILRVHITDKRKVPFPGIKLVHYLYQAPTAQGFCLGDSGGPIYFKNNNNNSFELVGVMSSGPCECDLRPSSGKTEKITFIPEYLEFIESIKNVDESRIRKQTSLEAYEKTGAMYFVLPDHNNIAKLKYFNTPKSTESQME